MPSSEPLLRLTDVARDYTGPGGGTPVSVLSGINLDVAVGESLAIMGPSGCGKSTLLNLLGTLDRPSRGTITLEGRNLTQLKEVELAQVRNRSIGFVFQSHHLLPQCTVLENVLIPTLGATSEVLRDGAPDRARRLLDRVGLGHRLRHRPGELSGGERQRVAVVRAMINQPVLLLADEPTGALDRAAAEMLGDLLAKLNTEDHITLVVVTHSMELAQRMHRILELRDGKLVPHDAPKA